MEATGCGAGGGCRAGSNCFDSRHVIVTPSCRRSVQGLLEVTASRLKIVADRRHGLSRAVRLHFRRSVENQQIFDSSSEASRLLQPPRHLSSAIRLTEQTACCPPAPSDSSSLTGGCDGSSQNQEQCTTYTRSGLAWLLTQLLSIRWRGRNDV